MEQDEKLLIFNIQKYSLHDGDGIRTVVFLKGCPLKCRWCANPESQNPFPEIMYRKNLCLGEEKCGFCQNAAPKGLISFDKNGFAKVDHRLKIDEFDWIECCPSKALQKEGRLMILDEVIRIVEQDSVFYKHGKGGMTLSGGEPLAQKSAIALLRKAKEHHINTAIETCGYVDQKRLLEAAEYLDIIFFDIKSTDDIKHEEYTGVSGKRIRNNLRTLYEKYPEKEIIVRTPVIPGFNDRQDELDSISGFLKDFPQIKWERLKYHKYGVGKYEMLGRKYLM